MKVGVAALVLASLVSVASADWVVRVYYSDKGESARAFFARGWGAWDCVGCAWARA
jgi:hypothetical protein